MKSSSLTRKLRILPKRGFGRIVECIVVLWCVLSDERVPTWAKVIAATALAYFICPLDALPDFLPTGFADDAALLVAAFGKIAGIVSEEHRASARRKLRDLGL